MNASAAHARRVINTGEADILISDVIRAIDLLEAVLVEETDLLKAGRISDAMALSGPKSGRAGDYMKLLEAVKANAIALARYTPDGVRMLRERHGGFAQILSLNEMVLATVRSVSESLVRGLHEEANSHQRVSTYGPARSGPAPRQPSGGPLSLSVKL